MNRRRPLSNGVGDLTRVDRPVEHRRAFRLPTPGHPKLDAPKHEKSRMANAVRLLAAPLGLSNPTSFFQRHTDSVGRSVVCQAFGRSGSGFFWSIARHEKNSTIMLRIPKWCAVEDFRQLPRTSQSSGSRQAM